MTLYLLRHAEAEDVRTTDFERALTPKGEEQAGRMGEFCARQGILPEIILHSPLRRTVQTADLFVKAFAAHPAKANIEIPKFSAPWLASGMVPEAALEELRALTRSERVMLVGHEPDLGELAATLLGLPVSAGVRVRKASLMSLLFSTALRPGAATLDFFLPVSFL